jgi:hypothetical protein
MKDALRAEEVLCGDETPVNVIRKGRRPDGKEAADAPHAAVIRTPDGRQAGHPGLPAVAPTRTGGPGPKGAAFATVDPLASQDQRHPCQGQPKQVRSGARTGR